MENHGQVEGVSRPDAGIKWIVRWAFLLYALSLPFEMGAHRSFRFEVTTMTGMAFLLATLWQPRICFRRPPMAFWWFLAYLYLFVMLTIFQGGEYEKSAIRLLLQLMQQLLTFWAAYNILRYDRIARNALLFLVAACALLCILQLMGITSTTTEEGSGATRVTALGQNPNSLARNLVVGLLALIGLAYDRDNRPLRPRIVAWPLFALIGITIIHSGSRMGLLAFGGGLLAFALRAGSVWSKVRNVSIIVLAIGLGILATSQSDTMRSRIERTIEEGSLAKRELIYPMAWQMFREKPLIGWGPVTNMWILGHRIGERDHRSRDTHDLFLELVTSVGILGATPFLIGLWLCVSAAWKGRRSDEGVLPLALMVAILLANISGNLLGQKLMWFVLAYAVASGNQFADASDSQVHTGRQGPSDPPPQQSPRPFGVGKFGRRSTIQPMAMLASVDPPQKEGTV